MEDNEDIPKVFYLWLKPLSLGSNKCHFIAEVKDGEEVLIVYKNWLCRKRRWSYIVESKWIVNYKIRHSDGADGKPKE